MKFLLLSFFSLSLISAHAASEKAVLAGGCFWCLEPPLEALPGVISVVSGYTGGKSVKPSYEDVSSGTTGHIESVEVTFDNSKVSYEKILEVFWKNIDPLDEKGQFCDKGEQYTSGIFYNSDSQKSVAEKTLAAHTGSGRFKGKKIATFLRSGAPFYAAEDYHQDYYKKNPVRYKFYRYNCGRDQRLESVWGKSDKH